MLEGLSGDAWGDNPKGRLQDFCQRRWKRSPAYRVLRNDGPAHAQVFVTEVVLGDGTRGTGTGRTKQDSEKSAAVDALRRVGSHPHAHHRPRSGEREPGSVPPLAPDEPAGTRPCVTS